MKYLGQSQHQRVGTVNEGLGCLGEPRDGVTQRADSTQRAEPSSAAQVACPAHVTRHSTQPWKAPLAGESLCE